MFLSFIISNLCDKPYFKGDSMTDTFTWLHFSDLHWGSNNTRSYWPNIETQLFEDIKNLKQKNNLSIDAILFTGDLVNKGGEYSKFNNWLGKLKKLFPNEEDFPILLSVPGNHDLERPSFDNDNAARIRTEWAKNDDIKKRIWEHDKDSGTWEVIQKAFANYDSWLKDPKRFFPLPEGFIHGLLPGDFAYTFPLKNGSKIGVLGLNSAFLHLDDGDDKNRYKGHLDLHISQLENLFNQKENKRTYSDWFKEHSLCLVMTHHPVDWLSSEGQKEFLTEINIEGRCALHLCGHMHENNYLEWSKSISMPSWKMWVGPSLFSIEKYNNQSESGDENYTDRRHGYSLGSISINKQNGTARIWPRKTNVHKRFVQNIDLAEKERYCDIDIKVNTISSNKITQSNKKIKQKINQEMKQLIIDYYSSEAVFDDLCNKLKITNKFTGNTNERVTALCEKLERSNDDSVDILRRVLLLRNKILTDECNTILIGDEQIENPTWASDFGIDVYGYWAEINIEGITQRLRWIKPGIYMMGSTTEHDRYLTEIQHKVILTDPFWMAEHVCTQELWENIMDNNPSTFTGNQLPVEKLTWYECKDFLDKINQKRATYQFYLPSEAQWEYCCRAGTHTPFSFGENITNLQVNYDSNDPYIEDEKTEESLHQSDELKTVGVKTRQPNLWGLYEMHGNVYEWCEDFHEMYEPGLISNPKGPIVGTKRILRGGAWNSGAKYLRSACREKMEPTRHHYSGFRFCCNA